MVLERLYILEGRELCCLNKVAQVAVHSKPAVTGIPATQAGIRGYGEMNFKTSKKMENFLSTLNDSYQTILDNSFDAIISIDMNGTIIDWNRRAESIFGWKAEEVIGKTLAETIIPK